MGGSIIEVIKRETSSVDYSSYVGSNGVVSFGESSHCWCLRRGWIPTTTPVQSP